MIMTFADNVEAYAPGSPIFALSGDDNLTGSSGKDLFVFAQPIGNDTIYNFNASQDQIDLIGYAGFASFADVTSHLTTDANGNALITLADGQSITLYGVAATSLSASNFVFDQTPITNNTGTMTIGDGAMLPLSGVINNTGTIALDSTGNDTHLELIQYGITLQGRGQVILSDSDGNVISGTIPSVTLTNVDNTISGAGQLGAGEMTLVNDGTIVATGTNALIIDTGPNVVINAGTLEATGSGGLIVNSDVENSGLIWAYGANITILGTVTGSGSALISGAAILEFGAASSINVTFAGDNFGTLVLDNPIAYTGQIFGFTGTSPQNSDLIDLLGIAFDAGTSWVYSDNAGSDTGGALTIFETVNGVTTAVYSITFGDGDYTTANFVLTTDGHGGTLIADPPADSGTATVDSTIENAGVIELNSTSAENDLQLIQTGATFDGSDQVALSDRDANVISGTSVTLNNEDSTISGAGQLGNGEASLTNSGTINATGADALAIDTGSNFVFNFGILEASGSGGLTVASAVANSGVLWANGANLTVHGDVSGNGTAIIDGSGSVDFAAASSANVVFGAGDGGTLKLEDSFHFSGTISGFNGADTIDLTNVNSATAAITYHENAQGTGGVLTVSDGTHAAQLSFLGQYSAANFDIVPDHAQGALISFHHDLSV
jgi:hypothetical protein